MIEVTRSTRRPRRGALFLLGLLLGLLLVIPSQLAAQPEALSPGRAEVATVLREACATFSWSEVEGAVGYELEIASLRHDGRILETEGHRLPAGSLSWTAGEEACLDLSVRYRWRARAISPSGSGAWSEPREVVVEPRSARLTTARRLLADLAAERLTSDQLDDLRRLGWGVDSERPRTAEPASAPGVLPLPAPVVTVPGSAAVFLENGDPFAVWAKSGGVSVWGETAASSGEGIRAEIDQGEALVTTVAVEGRSDLSSGIGVLGEATADPGNNSSQTQGVRGESLFGEVGVYGLATANGGATRGVAGQSSSPNGRGVCATASEAGTTIGAWGESASASGWDFYAGGTGMNYGPFTGSHEVRLDSSSPLPERGMVVSLVGRAETRRHRDGSVDLSSTMPWVALAAAPADAAVFGVYSHPFEPPDGHWLSDRSGRFAVVNALGEGRVWVTDRNGPVAAGDFLTTSDIPGHAQRQDETELRSHTLGKVIESLDWSTVTRTVTHRGLTYRTALVAVIFTSG